MNIKIIIELIKLFDCSFDLDSRMFYNFDKGQRAFDNMKTVKSIISEASLPQIDALLYSVLYVYSFLKTVEDSLG